ncbi:heme peroxidase [Coprinopsis marcescibilis]|uniref:Heme peroxidase n=1 Tax=Coprinopsis marcescibilis TaxID=230819 RepID=A0A5C3LLU6_COPMA|nr:heme peroxidase [Coprinopsis marcescibilis]
MSSIKRMSTMFRRKESSTANGSNGAIGVNTAGTSSVSPTVTSPTSPKPEENEGLSVLKDFTDKIKKGIPYDFNTSSIAAVLDLIRNKDCIDDRKLFLEHALTFISRLEEGPFAKTVRNKIIQLLYNDLTHPASTSISNQFAWRTADGSYNNIDVPDMGKAGTPYSRSVQQSVALPKNQLPDPGLLFDTLLRRDGFVEHPGGLSSLMFAFATLVIHSVFRTSHRDWNINETSSYVDLAPLYGNSEADQNRIRVRDGRGLLHPDVFAEDRLLLLPPAVCVLLVLFNRNHNYIAAKLLEINERGTYVEPSTLSLDNPAQKKKLLEQEEELFQTTRLVNVGWFGTVVFSDYFSCILGLVRDGSSWSLNPFEEMRLDDHSLFERGKGNVCSVEFNCLYRWHATTSREDEKWTEQIFDQIFPNKPFEDVTSMDFRIAAHKLQQVQPPPTEWTFGGLKRQADGSFKDADLANVLHDATEHSAGAFRARGTPSVMRLNEVMGIEQSRKWGVCSLNEFRKFLGLKPFSSFLEWNSNPDIARTAELLYGDVNRLELYVGLQAEEAKPLVDGAGLCPGYTISRAILSDAIALTRGDRFFTHDFTPFNLTSWGFQDCQRDPNAFGFGSTLGKLFLRTLPENFSDNSVYTFFPLMTPQSMATHLKKLNKLDLYDLSRPKARNPSTVVDDYSQIVTILKEVNAFRTPYGEKARKLIKGKGFYPAESNKEQDVVRKALSGSPELVAKIGAYFYDQTKKQIDVNSYALVGAKTRGIDLVRRVISNLASIWLTDLSGFNAKAPEAQDDFKIDTVEELFTALSEIYSFIFWNVEPAKVMVLQEKVRKHVNELLPRIKDNLTGTKPSITGLISSLFKYKKPTHPEVIQRLTENEALKDRDTLGNAVFALMIVANAEISLAATNMVDYYLGSAKAAEIQKAAVANDIGKLKEYVYEALRTVPPFAGVYRISTREQVLGGRKFAESERVFLDISTANNKVSSGSKDVTRGEGAFEYLGEQLTVEILAQILRGIFERPDLKRAPGHSGEIQRFRDDSRPECHFAYLNHGQSICEWPTSLSILYTAA